MLGPWVVSCSGGDSTPATVSRAIVYGADDRKEYYELEDDLTRAALAESAVALIPRGEIDWQRNTIRGDSPSLGSLENLCPDQPFAQQPSAAFCSGVLVDWDLVLTAGHCARVLAPEEFVAVLGYCWVAPGVLATTAEDIVGVSEIVAERLDPIGAEPRLDFAWFRLTHSALPPRQPALIQVPARGIEANASVTVMSAVGGTPMKLDLGGRVQDPRTEAGDFFVADTDTSHGSSGAGAFDSSLHLQGVLARGGSDFITTADGCQAQVVASPGNAEEQFTRIEPALAELCRDSNASSLCRTDCAEACRAEPFSNATSDGCSVGPRPGPLGKRTVGLELALPILALLRARRRRNR